MRDKYSCMTSVNLIHVRYVLEVVAVGSFSAAAKRCGVSQPAISNAVSELEEFLGGKVFTRTTRKVVLTPFGQHLLPWMNAVLASVSGLKKEALSLSSPSQKLLRIAFSPIINGQLLSHIVEPFRDRDPDAEVIYKECDVVNLERRLEDQSVDVVCGVNLAQEKRYARCSLYRDRLCYLPRGGASSKMPPSIELEEVARSRLVLTAGVCGLQQATRQLFEEARLPTREYAGQAMSYKVLEEWADLGIGAAILPETLLSKPSTLFPRVTWNGRPVSLLYEAVWNKDALCPLHVKEFHRYLKKIAPAIVKGAAFSPAVRSASAAEVIV